MAESNFQDVVVLSSASLNISAQAITLGSDAGAKSIVLQNDVGQIHIAGNPAAGTITINLPTSGGGTLGQLGAISAGTTQAISGTVVFSNSNGITFGMNGNTITATVTPGPAAGIGAISAGTTQATSGTVVFSNSNSVSFGMNGNTITASVNAGGVTLSYFNPQDAYLQVTGDQGNATLHFQPNQYPNVTFDRIAIPVFYSANTSVTATISYTYLWGAYTRNGSTLSTLLTTSITGTINQTGTVSSASYSGIRLLTIPLSSSLSGGQYYVGILKRSSTAGANATLQQLLASQQASNFSGILGVASNATNQYTRGLGVYTASTTALPDTVGFSQLNGTNSLVLRQPLYYVVNGTV